MEGVTMLSANESDRTVSYLHEIIKKKRMFREKSRLESCFMIQGTVTVYSVSFDDEEQLEVVIEFWYLGSMLSKAGNGEVKYENGVM